MLLKGTQRRLVVASVALAVLTPVALLELPAAAFPPGHKVFNFDYKVVAKTYFAKVKQAIAPPAGSFKGSVDLVTGQLNGGIKLPNATFARQVAGLGTVTAAISQVKPVAGRIAMSSQKVTATSTFVVRIVSVYASPATLAARPAVTLPPVTLPPTTLPAVTLPPVPTLPVTLPPGTVPSGAPPVNLVGNSCASASPIRMTLRGIAPLGSRSKLTGRFTMPKFKSCGAVTAVLNRLLAGPGNTFSATATPSSGAPPPSLPVTLPTLPVTLPTLPVTVPTLPVTLPTLPVTVPTLPVTLPTLPVTVPTLPSRCRRFRLPCRRFPSRCQPDRSASVQLRCDSAGSGERSENLDTVREAERMPFFFVDGELEIAHSGGCLLHAAQRRDRIERPVPPVRRHRDVA